jgi:hypothetical protein
MLETRRIEKDDVYCQRVIQHEKNPPRSKYKKEEIDNEPDAKILRKANINVTKPITRLSNLSGRPKKYTPTKIRNAINSYFTDCERRDKIPSLKSMMLYLKMTQTTMYNYMCDPNFEQIFQQARIIISEWIESDIYSSKGQVGGKLAYAQNLHNWTNRTEVETSNKEMTVEEAKAKIESLAPALLEMLKSSPELLKQLLPPEPQKVEEVKSE